MSEGKLPIPEILLVRAMQHGGAIDLSQGRLVIVTDVLPELLQKELEDALKQTMIGGEEIKYN